LNIPTLCHEDFNNTVPYIVTNMVGQKVREVGLTEAYKLTADILEVLQNLHGYGYVHNDIHPGNIINMCGKFRLIDFGLTAQLYNKTRIAPPGWPMGHITFASHNLGYCYGARDDLEALCYTVACMSNPYHSYWQFALHDRDVAFDRKETKLFTLFDHLPKLFRDFFEYAYNLDITVTPDYDHWQRRFRRASLNSLDLSKKRSSEDTLIGSKRPTRARISLLNGNSYLQECTDAEIHPHDTAETV
jgi:serine/threonine protein kinase